VEQIALCPAHMIPGMEPSSDKIFQVTKLMWQLLRLSADKTKNIQFAWICIFLIIVHRWRQDEKSLYNSAMLDQIIFISSFNYRPRQYLPTGHDHILSWVSLFSIHKQNSSSWYNTKSKGQDNLGVQ
jgi:hypothetical protein